MKLLLSVMVTVLGVSGLAQAEAPAADRYPSVEAVPKVLLAGLRHGESYRDQYIARLLEAIRYKNADAKGITRADIDAYAKRMENAKRRERYQQVIFYDLNFDATITQQEVGTVMIEERRRQKQSEEGCVDDAARFVSRYDSDRDGQISLPEMSTPEPDEARGRKDPTARRMGALLALDPDKDGTLTAAELDALARKAFSTFDIDGNGTLSPAESRDARDAGDDF